MTHRAVPHLCGLAVVMCFAGLLLLGREAINSASAVSVLLLAVVLTGRFWGTGPALTSAIVAAVTLLYFFLPPVGFSVADPNDWLSLVTFLIAGLLAGGMLARYQRAIRQRDHFERLYWTECGKSSALESDADDGSPASTSEGKS